MNILHQDEKAAPRLAVYFDGACPLCIREIGLLRRFDRHTSRIAFIDVSAPDAAPHCPIDRSELLARFHVRLPSGELVSGARAFTEAWGSLPAFTWLRPFGRFAVTRRMLDGLYGLFLKIRPKLQKWAAGQKQP